MCYRVGACVADIECVLQGRCLCRGHAVCATG